MTGIFEGRGERHTKRTPGDSRGGDWSATAAAKEHQGLTASTRSEREARKISYCGLQKEYNPACTSFWALAQQNHQVANFCGCNPPGYG